MKKHNFSSGRKCFNRIKALFPVIISIVLFSCKSMPNGTKVKAVDLLDNNNNFYISIPNAVDPELIKYVIKNNVKDISAKDVAEAIAPYFEDTDLALIEQVVERYRAQKSYAENPIIDEEEFQNLLDVMSEAGTLDHSVTYSDLVNRSLADAVVE